MSFHTAYFLWLHCFYLFGSLSSLVLFLCLYMQAGKAGKRLLLPVLLEDVNPQLAKGWLWACA